ncbi:peptide ABC transporter permease [Cellvibrio mixtus]|uniref:Peptide ABC transporter permease n=1 Tax=Cellvibrio mixtus TaxID=39650 RepID=A0A266Q7M4_9GAMM|nr:ABC transporter permease [Cellvibrio mixtus]OZY85626.1 peptide ABC transporter permease [Cellvibrio mixtus]
MNSPVSPPLSLWRRFLLRRDGSLVNPGIANEPQFPIENELLGVTEKVSPRRRIWLRFKRNRLGYWSLIIFSSLYLLSLLGEFISNDKPLVIHHEQEWYFPLFKDYPETVFGGKLPIFTDYNDPYIRKLLADNSSFAIYPPNPFYYDTLNYYSDTRHYPGPPDEQNLLGTDIAGYDIVARLIYGFRTSVTFGLGLTIVGTILGVIIGAAQGYFAGKVDLITQRVIEIWGSMPELYLLIIFSSLFEPSLLLLFVLLSLFGWIFLSDYVRAEFLRNRQLEYVKAAKAMGLSHIQIIWRHILPNSLTPVITFLPFRMSAAIMALASLDFLGLGVQAPAPSLGQLLLQGKENLDAWWIAVAAFTVLVSTLLLLTFMGEALRNAIDTRMSDVNTSNH